MIVIGVYEVGRGCWAGPVVAGAVVLTNEIVGLKDSKKLSKKQRTDLAILVKKQALAFGTGWASAKEVDALGLSQAVALAMRRAVKLIKTQYDEIIIDGNYNFLQDNHKSRALIKADDKIPAVSAASIIAKVERDNYMSQMDKEYPGYNFSSHVGYGTAKHLNSLKKRGVTDLHRKSFKPIKKFL